MFGDDVDDDDDDDEHEHRIRRRRMMKARQDEHRIGTDFLVKHSKRKQAAHYRTITLASAAERGNRH